MNDRTYYVYMMSNERNTVIYTGITNDLRRRVFEHKHKVIGGFASRYNVTKLVYFEQTDDVKAAIEREKQIKGGSRGKKVRLIDAMNKEWRDLAEEID